jgi:hypothetical protein
MPVALVALEPLVAYRDRGHSNSQEMIAMAVVRYREKNGDIAGSTAILSSELSGKLMAPVLCQAVPTTQN